MDFIFNPLPFFDFLYDFITTGIWELFREAIIWMMAKGLILYYEATKEGIEFAWSIASDVLQELNLSSELQSSFSSLPAATQQILMFFRIPECINTMLSALGTRFILKFIPFI